MRRVHVFKGGFLLVELKDFLYELNNFTTQAHTLKDCYDKLSDSEKQFIKDHSPATSDPPHVIFENTIELVRALNEHLANN